MEFPPAVQAFNPSIDPFAVHSDCSGDRRITFRLACDVDCPASVIAAEAVANTGNRRITGPLGFKNDDAGVVQMRVTREAGLALAERMMAR
jgi:hypothetical protein